MLYKVELSIGLSYTLIVMFVMGTSHRFIAKLRASSVSSRHSVLASGIRDQGSSQSKFNNSAYPVSTISGRGEGGLEDPYSVAKSSGSSEVALLGGTIDIGPPQTVLASSCAS